MRKDTLSKDLHLCECHIQPPSIHTRNSNLHIPNNLPGHNKVLLFEAILRFETAQLRPVGVRVGKATPHLKSFYYRRVHLCAFYG